MPFLREFMLLLGAMSITSAFDVTLSITYDNSVTGLQGSTASMDCSWSFSGQEYPLTVTFSSPSGPAIYTYTVGNPFINRVTQEEGWINNRMAATAVNASISSIILTLSNLQCGDEGNYTCEVTNGLDGRIQPPVVKQENVQLKVPPSNPEVVFVSGDPTPGIVENSTIQVSCRADTGSKDKGRLQWRIYRTDETIDIAASDPRVTESKSDVNCVETYVSTLSMTVTRADQELVITCFVQNVDFAPNLPPACEDTVLCDQTQRLRIHYPVSDSTIIVTHEPQDVYQGGSVTLSCRADGFPEATILWSKGNETLQGEDDGFGGSKLILSNLTVDRDSGVYNCTATNTVLQVVYSASKEVNIVVSSTPPPSTEPPTTQPSTTETSGSDNDRSTGGGGSDDTVIIVVVVVVVVVLIVIAVAAVVIYRRRNAPKSVEDPPSKPVNNLSNNIAFVNGSQPDLVAYDKHPTGSLNNSFDMKNEDGLMYADLTYDNRPRSRKPLALGDNASDYSDIQMPQV